MPNITVDQRRNARAGAMRFSRRATPEPDLLAELDERLNAIARYEADLAGGDFSDGDAGQLHGGIAYERFHVEAIVAELEARERARAQGHRASNRPAEGDLPARFAAARAIDAAEVIRELTGQAGERRGANVVFVCPWHGGGRERTPSLTAYPGDRGWYCFGCVVGGDAVRFVMELHGIGAVEALRLLEAGALGARVAS